MFKLLAITGLALISVILFVGYGYQAMSQPKVAAFALSKSRCPERERPFNHYALIALGSMNPEPRTYAQVVRLVGRYGEQRKIRDESTVFNAYVWCDGQIKLTCVFDEIGRACDLEHGTNEKWFPNSPEQVRRIEAEENHEDD